MPFFTNASISVCAAFNHSDRDESLIASSQVNVSGSLVVRAARALGGAIPEDKKASVKKVAGGSETCCLAAQQSTGIEEFGFWWVVAW